MTQLNKALVPSMAQAQEVPQSALSGAVSSGNSSTDIDLCCQERPFCRTQCGGPWPAHAVPRPQLLGFLSPRISSQQLPWDKEEKGLAVRSLALISVLPSRRWELGQVSGLLGTPAEDSVRVKNGQNLGVKTSTRHPTVIPKVTVNSKRSPEPIPWEPPKSPPHSGVDGVPASSQVPRGSMEPAGSMESVVSPLGLQQGPVGLSPGSKQNELPWGRGLRPRLLPAGLSLFL